MTLTRADSVSYGDSMKRPSVVSDTIQEFGGVRYYRCGKYFRRTSNHFKGSRLLHRDVYAANHGDIPDTHHVHHVDEDRSNNSPENLQLLPISEHCSIHAKEAGALSKLRGEFIGQEKAKAWHRSEEGRAWHAENSRRAFKRFANRVGECIVCSKTYMYSAIPEKRFCGQACFQRLQRRTGAYLVSRNCVICCAEFRIDKHEERKYCSKGCIDRARLIRMGVVNG